MTIERSGIFPQFGVMHLSRNFFHTAQKLVAVFLRIKKQIRGLSSQKKFEIDFIKGLMLEDRSNVNTVSYGSVRLVLQQNKCKGNVRAYRFIIRWLK